MPTPNEKDRLTNIDSGSIHENAHQFLVALFIMFTLINLLSFFFFCFMPFVIPIWTAEFSLLMIVSAFGPGPFWKRFAICLIAVLVLGACPLIALTFLTRDVATYFEVLRLLVPLWILCQMPLLLLRGLLGWQIAVVGHPDARRISILDLLTATAVVGIAMACLRDSDSLRGWLASLETGGPRFPLGLLMLLILGGYLSAMSAGTMWILSRPNGNLPLRIAWFTVATILPPIVWLASGGPFDLLVLTTLFLIVGLTEHHLIVFVILRELESYGLRVVTRVD